MRFLATLFRNLSRHGAVERDLDEEVHAHFELLVDEYRATGMEDAAARRAARLELGGTGQVKDAVRDVRRAYGSNTSGKICAMRCVPSAGAPVSPRRLSSPLQSGLPPLQGCLAS